LNDPETAARRADLIGRLDALAAELAARGWTATVCTPRGRVPSVHARNPEPGAAALSEHIYSQPGADGRWAYWWPWAEPIAEAPDQAASVIVRVLRPAGTP
jgi:hypothetical protein